MLSTKTIKISAVEGKYMTEDANINNSSFISATVKLAK
jgi:hypothetical protein